MKHELHYRKFHLSDINLHTSVKIALLYKKHFGRQNKWKHFHIFISHNKKKYYDCFSMEYFF